MLEDSYLSPNNFIIYVEPSFSEKDEWTGEVEVSVCYSEDNILDEDGFETLFTLTHLICSSVPFFADHPEIMSLAKSYMDKEQETRKEGTSIASIINKRFDRDNVIKGSFTKDNNVIHMNFKNRED
tara:strand:- start:451 stop:828 length:378 start_codon:yes stop_codon:yes gene_type:complete